MFFVSIFVGFLLSKIWSFFVNSNVNNLGESAKSENTVIVNNTKGQTRDTIEDYNKNLYEKTDIYTEYLPSQDIERLKKGIYVYTVKDLNSELENLE